MRLRPLTGGKGPAPPGGCWDEPGMGPRKEMGGASPPPGLCWVWGGRRSLPVSHRRVWELWTLRLMSPSSELTRVFCFFYLLLFLLPSLLLLLFFALAHLLQRGRGERSQEVGANRGQQRGQPAVLQRGANRSIILQLFAIEEEKKDLKNKSKKICWTSGNEQRFTAASRNSTSDQSELVPAQLEATVWF